MKKSEVEHVLRAAAAIVGDNEFIIIGSQSLHGKYPDLADEILKSQEVDLLSKNKMDKTDFLNVIGMDSTFHETFGYYADPVDAHTATLPKHYRNRLVHLKQEGSGVSVKAYCLEPHDLVVAKLAAGRDKDHVFIRALLARKLINAETIRLRLRETRVSSEKMASMTTLLAILIRQAEGEAQ
ncbi:converved hypothetical protein [Oxalobacteraceae bacterium IMCC9480]|nr:converved hypothetical protein [Oxalobacteraceae bacterium IMCC9480]